MTAIMAVPNPDELTIDDLPDEYEEIIEAYQATDDELDVVPSWHAPGRWVEDASCTPWNADMWFPDRRKGGQAGDPSHVKQVKEICRFFCPVQKDCLEFALEHDERDGIWGGMDYEERQEELLRRMEKSIGLVA